MNLKGKTSPDRWVDEYADAMFRYARIRINDREAARDLVQETFLSGLQNIGSFKGESSEKTWLYAILKNKIVDHYRKFARDASPLLAEDGEESNLDQYFGQDGEWQKQASPTDWGVSPHDDYRSKEFHDILHRCLGMLKEQWRTIFTLKYLEELESEEICKDLGISPSNYWVIMHRAKLTLRRCVEKNWLQA